MIQDILFYRNIMNNLKSSTSEFDFGLLKEGDLVCFSKRGEDLLAALCNADLCFVARKNEKAIHHTCVSLKTFLRPGSHQKLYVGNNEAFIYEVFTKEGFRGYGIAIEVLNYINNYLNGINKRKIYAYVAKDNIGSRRLFHKAGYHVYGRQYLTNLFQRNILIVLSKRRCFVQPLIFRLPFIRVYRVTLPDMERIDIEIESLVKEWKKNNLRVALFGGGAHSRLLIENISSLRYLIQYVFDNDLKKQGTCFDPLRLIIDSSDQIKSINPEVIIVSSKNFQEEIILQLISDSSVTTRIVRCYPIVEYVSK